MNKILRINVAKIVLLFLFFPLFMMAQVTIRGIAKDKNGNLLKSVRVELIPLKKVDYTDNSGRFNFKIKSVPENLKLEFSGVGLETTVLNYTGTNNLVVLMTRASKEISTQDPKIQNIKEVVLVYKPNINNLDLRTKTGNVSSVKIGDLRQKQTSSIVDALVGGVPGLQITNSAFADNIPKIRIRGTSTFRDAQPRQIENTKKYERSTADYSVNIEDAVQDELKQRRENRNNEPLYVLDGQIISADIFYRLDANIILDIKILKDAVSTALYGIRAANGVIEITTNRLSQNKKYKGNTLTGTYNYSVGYTFREPRRLKMMNTAQKLEFERRLKNPAAPGYLYSEEYIRQQYTGTNNLESKLAHGKFKLDSLSRYNTDWYKELAKGSYYTNQNLNLYGGTKKSSYSIGIAYNDKSGSYEGSSENNYSANFTIDRKIFKKTIVSLSAIGGISNQKTTNGSNESFSSLIYKLNPYETPDSKSLFSYEKKLGFKDFYNNYRSEKKNKYALATLGFTSEIFKGLILDGNAGYNYSTNDGLRVQTPDLPKDNSALASDRGVLNKSNYNSSTFNYNVRLNYAQTFGKFDLNLGVNNDYSNDVTEYKSKNGRGLRSFYTNDFSEVLGAITSEITTERTRQIGVGGVAGFTFDKTYDLYGTIKKDGSSILPKDKRWNTAWAIGAAINLKSYFKDFEFIKNLKIRASYGHTANIQGISASSVVSSYNTKEQYKYADDYFYSLKELPNRDLRPEKNINLDYGLSFDLKTKTRIGLTIYNRRTKDALLSVDVPSTNGFSSQLRNVGVLENKGFEITLDQRLFRTENWTGNFSFNISKNTNKVVDLYGQQTIYVNGNILPLYEVGKSIGDLYGYQSLGINPFTGLPEFIRPDGSEIDLTKNISKGDFVNLGKGTAPYYGGFSFTIAYKKWDLSAFFDYQFGGIARFNYDGFVYSDHAYKNAIVDEYNLAWYEKGDRNKLYPSPLNNGEEKYNFLAFPNNKSVGKTDYLRLSSINLSYYFTDEQIYTFKQLGLKRLNLGISANNVFTLNRYHSKLSEVKGLFQKNQLILKLNIGVDF